MSHPRIEVVLGGRRIACPAGVALEVDHEVAEVVAGVGDGEVHLDGQPVTTWSVERRIRAGLVVLGHVDVAGEVSIRDHLLAVHGASVEAVEAVLSQAPLLAGRDDDPAGWLSGGERQVLGWLRTILLAPRAVLLDVAGRGLDGPTLRWAGGQVRAWADAGSAVLVHVGRPEEAAWLASEPRGPSRA